MMSSGKGENEEGRREGRQRGRVRGCPEEGEGEKEWQRNKVICHEDETNYEI